MINTPIFPLFSINTTMKHGNNFITSVGIRIFFGGLFILAGLLLLLL